MASPQASALSPTFQRRSRFAATFGYDSDTTNEQAPQLQQRATSQPPRAQQDTPPRYDHHHLQRRLEESSVSPPPASSRKLSTSSASTASGWPPAIARPTPTPSGSRSVSFSTFSDYPIASMSSAALMSASSHFHPHENSFPSTFEDDEASDGDFDYATPRRQDSNHTKSRPQSIGPAIERRTRPINTAASSFGANYGFTQGGYGSIGSGSNNVGSTPSSAVDDHTNMSPFMRDVSRILPPDGVYNSSSSRAASGIPNAHHPYYGGGGLHSNNTTQNHTQQMWGGGGGGGTLNGGGGTAANSFSGLGLVGGLGGDDLHTNGGASGTTSRRHSVSVLQPRRISVGFNVGYGANGGGGVGEEPPSPISTTSERPPNSGFRGGAMFSDEELAGSLNILSLSNVDESEEYQRRPMPRVSGPSQPSSLPTYAPHQLHQHRGSPLDTLRLPQNMNNNNNGTSSPTSSLGAPGDDFDFRRRTGLGSLSRSSSAARYSDGDRSSPEHRQSSQSAIDPYSRGAAAAFNGMIGNGHGAFNRDDPLAGVFGVGTGGGKGGGIPSPNASFRAVDALKQPSTYSAHSQFQDMFENSNNSPTQQQQQQTRARAASASMIMGNGDGIGGGYEYDYDATVTNTPSGPISMSPTNSVRMPSQQYVTSRMSPTTAVGLGYGVGIGNGYIGGGGGGGQYYPAGPGVGVGSNIRPRQNSLPPASSSPTAFHHHQQQMMYQQHQQQQQLSPQHSQHQQAPTAGGVDVGLGRGVPLYAVPRDAPLYIVEFKAGRNDIFYVVDPQTFYSTPPSLPSNGPPSPNNSNRGGELRVGELVIVEADRGRDLGKVTHGNISTADVEAWQRQQAEIAALAALQQGGGGGPGADGEPGSAGGQTKGVKELMPKKIYARATAEDTLQLHQKNMDEQKALQLCQSKVRQKKLPMEVVDAEYQWDRRKLTFYFVADRRIDFRELVRELFRLYKTRIWMACLQGPPTSE